MPIRTENKNRYPKDWKLRSRFVRFVRAKNRCEWCGLYNYSIGHRDANGKFIGIIESGFSRLLSKEYFFEWIDSYDYKSARAVCDYLNTLVDEKLIVIVLTVAHVHNHNPEAANLLNLAALCQKCHNDHDLTMRKQNRKLNSAIDAGQLRLI